MYCHTPTRPDPAQAFTWTAPVLFGLRLADFSDSDQTVAKSEPSVREVDLLWVCADKNWAEFDRTWAMSTNCLPILARFDRCSTSTGRGLFHEFRPLALLKPCTIPDHRANATESTKQHACIHCRRGGQQQPRLELLQPGDRVAADQGLRADRRAGEAREDQEVALLFGVHGLQRRQHAEDTAGFHDLAFSGGAGRLSRSILV